MLIKKTITAGAITAFGLSLALGLDQGESAQSPSLGQETEQQQEQQEATGLEMDNGQETQEFGARPDRDDHKEDQAARETDDEQEEFGAAFDREGDQPNKLTDFEDAEVTTQDGQRIGRFEDILVDVETGEISFIIVAGQDDQRRPIPADLVQVSGQGEDLELTVNIDQQQWESAPSVERDEVTELGQEDRAQEIHQHFGEQQETGLEFGAPPGGEDRQNGLEGDEERNGLEGGIQDDQQDHSPQAGAGQQPTATEFGAIEREGEQDDATEFGAREQDDENGQQDGLGQAGQERETGVGAQGQQHQQQQGAGAEVGAGQQQQQDDATEFGAREQDDENGQQDGLGQAGQERETGVGAQGQQHQQQQGAGAEVGAGQQQQQDDATEFGARERDDENGQQDGLGQAGQERETGIGAQDQQQQQQQGAQVGAVGQQDDEQETEFGMRDHADDDKKSTKLGRDLTGSSVIGQDDEELGEIADLMVDLQEGRVSFVLIEDAENGDQYLVSLKALEADDEDRFSLNVSKDELDQAESLSRNDLQREAREQELVDADEARQSPEIFRYEDDEATTGLFGAPEREETERDEDETEENEIEDRPQTGLETGQPADRQDESL